MTPHSRDLTELILILGGNITINYNGNTGAVNQTTNVAPAKPNA